MKKRLLVLIALLSTSVISYAQELPENAEPGKCYVKCVVKDEFEEVEETFEVNPAYTKLEVVPAVYKEVEEQILVKEASKELKYIPAVYETVEVPYVKKEKGNELEVVPATFGEDSKEIEMFPKTSGWEYKQLEDCPSVNKEDCMTACFVEYPAKFQNFPFVTLTKDAYTNESDIVEVPATYTKQVVKEAARVEEIEIPAEYATITKEVLVSPATTTTVQVPAEYKTITKEVLKKKGGMTTWEEVDCQYLVPTLLPIFYEFDSAKLTKDSERIIDELLLPLLVGKNSKVEIMSHTDSRGNDDYNLSLSQQRANSVVNYLVSKGIKRSRMIAKGYGETRLVNKCANGVECTDEQHQENRRTEFRLLGDK